MSKFRQMGSAKVDSGIDDGMVLVLFHVGEGAYTLFPFWSLSEYRHLFHCDVLDHVIGWASVN